MAQAIVLIGPPAVGKGTLMRALAKDGHVPLEMKDLIHRKTLVDPDFHALAIDLIGQGVLLPDPVIEELIERALDDVASFRDVVIDGYPRNEAQAGFLRKYLLRRAFEIHFVVLQLHDAECIRRMARRAAQSSVSRSDDKDEVHAGRLGEYQRQLPLIEKYLKKCSAIVHHIDASRNASEVYNLVRQVTHQHTMK